MADTKTIEQVRAARIEHMRKESESAATDEWFSGKFGSLQTGTGTKAVSLRHIVENPSDDLLYDLATRGDTPAARADAKRRLTARKISEVTAAFEAIESEFYVCDANYQVLLSRTAHNQLPGQKIEGDPAWALLDAGQLTVPALRESYHALRDEGRLIVPRGIARSLNAEQLDNVVALAETQGPEPALMAYLSHAFGGKIPHFKNGVSDLFTEYPTLLSQASTFVFESSSPDFVPSPEWESFKQQRTGHRQRR